MVAGLGDEDVVEALRGMPDLGDHRPKGWILTRVFFVDSSGYGEKGEAAMTIEDFAEQAVAGRGYGLIEQGQFQVHIGEFARRGDAVEADLDHYAIFSPKGW